MKQAWETGEATLDGRFYQVDGARVHPQPLQAGGIPFWIAGAAMFLKQDLKQKAPSGAGATKPLSIFEVGRQVVDAVRRGQIMNGEMRGAFVRYLRPDFHPTDTDNAHLAAAYLSKRESMATA